MVRSRWEGTEVVELLSADLRRQGRERRDHGARHSSTATASRGGTIFRELKPRPQAHRRLATRLEVAAGVRAPQHRPRDDWPDDRRDAGDGLPAPAAHPDPRLQEPARSATSPSRTRRSGPSTRSTATASPCAASPSTTPTIRPTPTASTPNRAATCTSPTATSTPATTASPSSRGATRRGGSIGRPVENVTITNCTMLHGHGGVVDRQRDVGRRATRSRSRTACSRGPSAASASRRRAAAAASSRTCASATSS